MLVPCLQPLKGSQLKIDTGAIDGVTSRKTVTVQRLDTSQLSARRPYGACMQSLHKAVQEEAVRAHKTCSLARFIRSRGC